MKNVFPRRRTHQLSIQQVGQETLIYDEQTHNAFCLNPVAAAVWNLCDGETSAAVISVSASFALKLTVSEELVQLSLEALASDGLLESESPPPAPATISRRAAVSQLGVGAAMLLPVIAVIARPKAAQAYTGCVNCTAPSSTGTRGRRQ